MQSSPGVGGLNSAATVDSSSKIQVVSPVKGAITVALPAGLKTNKDLAGKYVEAFVQSASDKARAFVRVGNQIISLGADQSKQLSGYRVGQRVVLKFESPKTGSKSNPNDFNTTGLNVSKGGALAGTVSKSVSLQNAARVLLVATQLGFLSEVASDPSEPSPEKAGKLRVPLGTLLGLGDNEENPIEFLSKNTGLLASQLQAGVSKSGLFYESHLERWVMGKVSTEDLSDEPQFDWNKASALTNERAKELSPDQQKSAYVASQQLNMLDNPKILLTLPGMYGEKINIEIFPDPVLTDENEDRESQDLQRGWNFTLSMDLKDLGPIYAHFRVLGDEIALSMETSDQAYPLFIGKESEIGDILGSSNVNIKKMDEKG